MLGAAMGFPVTLCVPSNVSPERKNILAAYGANVIWTDPADGSDGAIRMARKLIADEPDRYFYADQYGNDNNWLAHYHSTANEIWQQTDGQITHFVAGLGTSGTFMGTTRRLRELNPRIQCISMQPDSPFNGLEGLKHMATAIVPPIYDPTLADRNIDMPTERAYAMCKRLGRTQGLLLGVSAGAAVAAARDIAEEEARANREAVIVTILPDSADKYLSDRFWSEDHEEQAVYVPDSRFEPRTHAHPEPKPKRPRTLLRYLHLDLQPNRLCPSSSPAPSTTTSAPTAKNTYPNECCGILLGRADADAIRVTSLLRAGNTRTDSAHNRYHIAPEELIAAQRQARNSGLDIVGFYHSHPDHPAQWSHTDFAEAHWFGCAYVITAVAQRQGRAHQLASCSPAPPKRTSASSPSPSSPNS